MDNNFYIRVTLVRTLYDRNIGSTSRAMANMGVYELILLDPHCELTYEAQLAAATGQEALKNLTIIKTWSEFNRRYPEGWRLAFTSRKGHTRVVESLIDTLKKTHPQNETLSKNQTTVVDCIFGPEDCGLNNEDIQNCHTPVYLNTYGVNPSLNLAQAVLLALYTLRMQIPPTNETQDAFPPENEANEPIDEWFPETSFKKFLLAMSMERDDERKKTAYSSLKHFFLRNRPTPKEKKLLKILFEQAARKIKN